MQSQSLFDMQLLGRELAEQFGHARQVWCKLRLKFCCRLFHPFPGKRIDRGRESLRHPGHEALGPATHLLGLCLEDVLEAPVELVERVEACRLELRRVFLDSAR